MKKMTMQNLKEFRDSLQLPIRDAALEADLYQPPYYNPGPDTDEIRYLKERRERLGGFVPERRVVAQAAGAARRQGLRGVAEGLGQAGDRHHDGVRPAGARPVQGPGDRQPDRADHPGRGPHVRHGLVLPERRRSTTRHGQLYTAVDANLMLAYKESEQGIILHEGIDEAGSVATFTAVSTAYATHGEPMIPMYIFYSMFGFQRTGDGFWAIGDQMGRGFVLGATAGRTTLTGEGLQHADGHSHLLAATQPHVVAYDPAYGYEIAHIVKDGLRRMYGGSEECPPARTSCTTSPCTTSRTSSRSSRTISTSRAAQGHLPAVAGRRAPTARRRAQLLASGVGVRWALEAQELLAQDWDVAADVWSVTSWTELSRDAEEIERARLLDPGPTSARRTSRRRCPTHPAR